jgi:hypothetical protein
MEQQPIMLFPSIMRTLLINPEMDIFEQSFNSQTSVISPLCKEFKETLEEHTVDETDIENKLSCAICQDSFLLNEKIIKLPCDGTSHFFHKEKQEDICDGIFPWFEEHNTCPVCRHEFPKEQDDQEQVDQEQEGQEQEGQEQEDQEQEEQHSIYSSEINIETQIILTPEQISDVGNNESNILNEIDEMLRSIINPINDTENTDTENTDTENTDTENTENTDTENTGPETENITQQITSFINNVVREEFLRQREEEDIQQAILLSMER